MCQIRLSKNGKPRIIAQVCIVKKQIHRKYFESKLQIYM